MFYAKIVVPLFICTIICSCIYVADATGKKKLPKKRSTIDSDYKYYECPPAMVGAATIGVAGRKIGNPFTKAAALRAIIPEKLYKVYESGGDSVDMVVWICNDGVKKKVAGVSAGEPPTVFPLPEGNMTQAMDTLQYTDDHGCRNIIFSFATHPLQLNTDDMHSGRFSGAYLGLARFTEENGKWVLENYTNGIGCYGMFHYLPNIHLIKLGKDNYGCYLIEATGGPAQVTYSDLYVYGLVNNQFKTLLSASAVGRTNTLTSNWHMELSPIAKQDVVFSPLRLTIAGDFNNTDLDFVDDSASNAPIELHTQMKTSQKFDFKVVREYGFKGGKYVKTAAKTELK